MPHRLSSPLLQPGLRGGGSAFLNSNSNLYMWEANGPNMEDDMEFETDIIGNTNEIVYTNKRLMQLDQ
jgi:hypothetical protein